MFLFSNLTYFVQLLYLGKLSRPKYQQKLNKIMKISQEDVILVKNLYLSKQCGTRRVLSELLFLCTISLTFPLLFGPRAASLLLNWLIKLTELPDKGWKLGSIDSLLRRSHKTGIYTIVPLPGSVRPRLSRSSGEDLVLSQDDKRKRHRSAR